MVPVAAACTLTLPMSLVPCIPHSQLPLASLRATHSNDPPLLTPRAADRPCALLSCGMTAPCKPPLAPSLRAPKNSCHSSFAHAPNPAPTLGPFRRGCHPSPNLWHQLFFVIPPPLTHFSRSWRVPQPIHIAPCPHPPLAPSAAGLRNSDTAMAPTPSPPTATACTNGNWCRAA